MSQPENSSSVANKARLLSNLTIAQLLALCLLLMLWDLVIWPPKVDQPWIIVAFQCLPLLAFLPFLLRKRHKSYVWVCFFVLLYFCQGVINAFLLPHVVGFLGILEALLTVGLFITAMYAARYLRVLNR